MDTQKRRPTRQHTTGNSRFVKSAAMLLMPMLVWAIAACDNGSTPTPPPAPTVAVSTAPYANSPEGKPKGLNGSVPNPNEQTETKPAGQLPDFISQVDASQRDKVTALYKAAVANYNSFKYVPCYCGCAIYQDPHKSLAQCYIQNMAADGSITFTDHSLTCDICQGDAKMLADGLAAKTPLKDIRAAIFQKFKYTDIWTDTPPVPSTNN